MFDAGPSVLAPEVVSPGVALPGVAPPGNSPPSGTIGTTGRDSPSIPMFSSWASSPVTIPESPSPPASSLPPVEEFVDASCLSSGRAPLRLTDLVAAVRVTGIPNVQAVADRLETNYDVTTEAGTLSMVLVATHAARQDLARSMREDVLRLRMAGVTAEVIIQSALRYLDTVLADEFTY